MSLHSRMRALLVPRTAAAVCAAAVLALTAPRAAGQACWGSSSNDDVRLEWRYTDAGLVQFYIFPWGRAGHELELTAFDFSTYGVEFEETGVYTVEGDPFDVTPVPTPTGIRFDYTLGDVVDGPTSSGISFWLRGVTPRDPNHADLWPMRSETTLEYGIRDLDTDEHLTGTLDFVTIRALDCSDPTPIDTCNLRDSLDCDADGILDACALAAGLVEDCNADGVPDSCQDSESCRGDFDGDQRIDHRDLAELLQNFGGGPETDLTCDRKTDLADLATLLANYGRCF